MKHIETYRLLLALVLVAASLMPAAEASTIVFKLTDTKVSGFAGSSFGSIAVTQDSANKNAIDITLTLNGEYRIHRTQGSQHPAFAFNLSGLPAVTISGLGEGFSVLKGGGSAAAYGDFPYAIACSGEECRSGYSSANYQSLSFVVAPVSNAFSLTPQSLVSNGSAYFTVDVQTPNGLTGNIASLNPVAAADVPPEAAVPEPGTLSILCLGLAALGLVKRPKPPVSAA